MTLTVSKCPACGSDVELDDGVRANEIVSCGDCMTELEVVAQAPVMLALAPEVEEDWGE